MSSSSQMPSPLPSQLSEIDETQCVREVDYETELTLRVWKKELKTLDRVFKYLMFDSFFRMATFNRMKYSKKDIKSLTDNGFFNVKVNRGNYNNFKLVCVFCNFVYSNEQFQELSVTSVKFHHNMTNPQCAGLRANRGITFQKPLEMLGLTNIGMKYFIKSKNQIRAVKPLYLDTMPKPVPRGQERLRCDVCFANIKNVLTSCNHVSICSVCFTSDKIPNQTKCIVCRKPFEFYCRVTLPEPTFGFSRDLDNLFSSDNEEQTENNNLSFFMELIARSGVRVTSNSTTITISD
jgi:Zinc finger, C3HC4 type (RING finger)